MKSLKRFPRLVYECVMSIVKCCYFPQGNDSWTIIEFLEHEFASQE